MFPRLIFLLSAATLLAFVASCARTEPHVTNDPAPTGPQLQVKHTEFHGESRDGHVRHSFEIESVGTEPLLIKDVVSSCGCTIAHPSKSEIPPGEVATIDVDLHVMPSRRESSVFVKSTDASRPVVELKIVATDAPERLIQFVPAIVRVAPESESDSEIELQSVLKIEQWSNRSKSFDFADLKFKSSDGIVAIESGAFTEQAFSPIVWDEAPVTRGEKEISVELLDRSVTLIPVRFRLRRNSSEIIHREYARLDLPSADGLTSALVTFEISAK